VCDGHGQKQFSIFIIDDWSKVTSEEEKNEKKIQSWNIDNFIKACGELHNNLKVYLINKSGRMFSKKLTILTCNSKIKRVLLFC
jgi:hypothetical protein